MFKYNLKDYVYLTTDPDQLIRVVTGICIRENSITYEITSGTVSTWHYEFEITTNKNYEVI